MTTPTPEEQRAIRRDVKGAVARASEDEDERMPDEIRALLDDSDT